MNVFLLQLLIHKMSTIQCIGVNISLTNRQNTPNLTILQSELALEAAAESSEFQFMLSRVHKAHFFQLEIRKKSGVSGMAVKKREFTPKNGNVDTYDNDISSKGTFMQNITFLVSMSIIFEPLGVNIISIFHSKN